jgi:hypothetical protein
MVSTPSRRASVKKYLIAAALLATAAAVAPLVAFSAPRAGDATQLAQAATPPAGAPGPGQMGPGRQGIPPMMRQRMMMRHGMMMRFSPQQRCINHVARRAGWLAYLGVKLDLTTAQQPLWDKLESVAQQEAQRERQACNAIKPGAAETIIERLNTRQQILQARLQGLEEAKEPVASLYKVLTPEQRMVLDHPFPFHFHRP